MPIFKPLFNDEQRLVEHNALLKFLVDALR